MWLIRVNEQSIHDAHKLFCSDASMPGILEDAGDGPQLRNNASLLMLSPHSYVFLIAIPGLVSFH